MTGRKNLESFGKLLPNRTNIVLTRDPNYEFEGTYIFHELDKAVEFAKNRGEIELMVIGGGDIYKQCMEIADRIYLTRVHTVIEGDTHFPEMGENWKIIEEKQHAQDDRHAYAFTFQVFDRV